MKTLLSIITAFVLLSCNDTGQSPANDTDSNQLLNADTVPTGNSSSPSEFNKGNSSPPGSTGGVDSAAGAGAAADKTSTELDNKHRELKETVDSAKKKH